jgi:hypothetical protein
MAFNKTPHKIQDHFYLGVDRVSESVTEIFATLAKHDERATLEAVAEFLCANTALPLPDVHTSAIDHIEQFTGQNLRWESLGLLWAHLERVGDLINAMRTRRVVWLDDRPDHEASQTCLTYCVELSKYFSAGNDLLLDISRRQGTLLSIFDGDASRLQTQNNLLGNGLIFGTNRSILCVRDRRDGVNAELSGSSRLEEPRWVPTILLFRKQATAFRPGILR